MPEPEEVVDEEVVDEEELADETPDADDHEVEVEVEDEPDASTEADEHDGASDDEESEEEDLEDLEDEDLEALDEDELEDLDDVRVGHFGDYGIDKPHTVAGISWLAVSTLTVTVIAGIVNARPLMFTMFLVTVLLTFLALTFVRSSRVGKLRERVRIVDQLQLEGSERVLDVGCGRGLLVIEMASRLDDDDAYAVGVDIWRTQDQSRNDPDAVYENAAREGYDEFVDVTTADARRLPFPDASFDAVTSAMALRHIRSFEGRLAAIREIDRVTVPGGRAVVVDLLHTKSYVQKFRACNWDEVTRSKIIWRLFPPVRYVTARKPEVDDRRRVAPTPEPPPDTSSTDGIDTDGIDTDGIDTDGIEWVPVEAPEATDSADTAEDTTPGDTESAVADASDTDDDHESEESDDDAEAEEHDADDTTPEEPDDDDATADGESEPTDDDARA